MLRWTLLGSEILEHCHMNLHQLHQENLNNICHYIVQGLNPSPQFKMKTKAECHKPVQGIDLVAEKIVVNFERRLKQLKGILPFDIRTF